MYPDKIPSSALGGNGLSLLFHAGDRDVPAEARGGHTRRTRAARSTVREAAHSDERQATMAWLGLAYLARGGLAYLTWFYLACFGDQVPGLFAQRPTSKSCFRAKWYVWPDAPPPSLGWRVGWMDGVCGAAGEFRPHVPLATPLAFPMFHVASASTRQGATSHFHHALCLGSHRSLLCGWRGRVLGNPTGAAGPAPVSACCGE